jgi:hypothetical protein
MLLEFRGFFIKKSHDKPLDVDWNLLWSELVYPSHGNTNEVIKKLLNY